MGEKVLKKYLDKIEDGVECCITMLQASEGDCFLLQFYYEENHFNMLIDCGVISCWDRELKSMCDQLLSKNECIDVLVLTHIDSDHIGGALKLLKEEKYYSLVKNIWFNGLNEILNISTIEAKQKDTKVFRKVIASHRQANDLKNEQISARQAVSVSNLISQAGIPVNKLWNGGPILGNKLSFEVAPSFVIDFLLPNENALNKLLSKFRKELNMINIGTQLAVTDESKSAFEYVLLDEMPRAIISEPISKKLLCIDEIEEWAEVEVDGDTSITNASSIALCIRFYGRKYLFPGDAVAEDLIKAVSEWRVATKQNLYFDVIKLPHHGSMKNCMKILDYIDGEYYLISTDGRKFSHPDKETLAKIVTRPTEKQRCLLFNYENEMYSLFSDLKSQEKYNFRVEALFQIEKMESR